ncbi:MAG: glycosyltransferase family 1 protein [Patescibacteria group bacterium]|jgi:glycosyltransferase involved in cell wall biosynthesis
MNIIIDLRPLETGNRYRGFGYYIYNLFQHLPKLDKDNHYLCLICSKDNLLYPVIEKEPNCEAIIVPYPKWRPRLNWIYDHFALPFKIARRKFDLYISLDFNMPLMLKPLRPRVKLLGTIHDLIPFILWDEYDFAPDRALLYRIQLFAAKLSNEIITISKASAEDIYKWLKVKPAKVHVTYLAVDDSYKPIKKNESDQVLNKYKISSPYIMTVGEYLGEDPRKNYDMLLGMLDIIKKKGSEKNLKIVYVGRDGGKHNEYEKIVNKMKKLGLEKDVIFTGFAPEEDMPALYGRAEAFIYPTRYEGFGLPILQAMATGCPVIGANNTSLPEVGGKAILLCETGNAEEFAEAYHKIQENRDHYVKLGHENVSHFSWDKTAEETLEIINKIASTIK